MTKQECIEIAIEDEKLAREVLDNPAYQRAITAIRAKAYDEFQKTPLFFPQRKREKLHMQAVAINSFISELESMMLDGRLARKELARRKK